MSDGLAGEVRPGQNFDQAALARWMEAHVPGFAGPLTVAQFSGGQSNPTYKLGTPGRDYVLRRKPPGKLLPGAHAIEREMRVLQALETVDFPVPHVYALCADESVLGTAFYVMDLVAGRIFWDGALGDTLAAERPRYYDAMNETLARLHCVDYQAIGLRDYGKAGNYFARQIGRWSKQYLEDEAAGRDPNLDRLVEWLPENIPPGDETSIVHGDFRVDNMIFHATEPRVIAVLDWELSTLGHPLGDFAFHLMAYYLPAQVYTGGLLGRDVSALNIPSPAAYTAAYCRRTKRDGIANLDFYLAFQMFRYAAILHGIKGRILRGNASSASAEEKVAGLSVVAELAWKQVAPAT